MDCGWGCQDVTSDPNNCGECLVTCSAGFTCMEGGCTCPAGESELACCPALAHLPHPAAGFHESDA